MDNRDAEPREAAWGRVSEQFASLGDQLRRRYDEREGEEGRTRETVQEALRSLGDAAERLAATVSSAVRDPDIQAEARRAATSLIDALGMTFSRVTGDVRRRMDRSGDDEWDTPPPAPQVEIIETTDSTETADRRPEE